MFVDFCHFRNTAMNYTPPPLHYYCHAYYLYEKVLFQLVTLDYGYIFHRKQKYLPRNKTLQNRKIFTKSP